MKLKYLPFEQPIGHFALSVMPIKDILKIALIERREFDQVSLDSKGGPQREASQSRINEISKYAETADATFPTPILLALPEDSYIIDENYIELFENKTKASVVDGQHRLLGIENSKYVNEFNLPVVFILDATDEQKALIFAIINGKQTRVSASVIYDLFDVVEGRNPYKTAHEIARALNQDVNSPFYRRLKMLGKKFKESNEVLSQGTFVTQLVKLISSNPSDDFNKARAGQTPISRPNSIFNSYFLNEKDEFILKILTNTFNAVKDVFPVEWENSDKFILAKTTGYTAIMKTLPTLFNDGHLQKDLSFEYFQKIFLGFKEWLNKASVQLNSENFPPNSIGENKLKDKILESRRI